MKKLVMLLSALSLSVLLFGCADTQTPPDTDDNTAISVQDGQTENGETDSGLHPSGLIMPWIKDPLNGSFISPQAEAVVTVAEAYFNRSVWLQYDNKYSAGGNQMYRLQYRENSPEDLTSQHTGYTNCSHFVYDVYYEALGVDIGHLTTKSLSENAVDMQVFFHKVTDRETEEQKLSIAQQFLDTLQQGDIIVCRHRDDGGHAMLYIGDGMMTESLYYGAQGGGDYDYDNNRDRIEVQGTVAHREVMIFFDKTNYNYFWKEKSWAIVRPLDKYSGAEIPQNTRNRIKNLKDIYVEKTSTHPVGRTADLGEDITYSFHLRSMRDEPAVIDIADRLPENTTYISGCDNAEGDTLSWKVTVPAGGSVTVSYTVRVNNDPDLYNDGYIESEDATVGGVRVRTQKVFIGRHLTDIQQGALSSQTSNMSAYTQRGMELANILYKNAGIDAELLSLEEMLTQVFEQKGALDAYKLVKQGKYQEMVIPSFYGGRQVYTSSHYARERTRGVKEYQLYIGDIMIGSEYDKNYAYMYAGRGRIIDLLSGKSLAGTDVQDILMSGWGMEMFAFIRPAAVYNDYD